MKRKNDHTDREWFRDWFDENYELVYGSHDEAEAESFVGKWPVNWSVLSGGWALDLGCGNGRFARALARRGLKVFGLDLSKAQLLHAGDQAKDYSHVHFVRGDLRRIPAKGRFQLIASLFTSFGYFESDAEHQQVLNCLASMLNSRGICVIDLPNAEFVRNSIGESSCTTRIVQGVTISESRSLSVERNRIEKNIHLQSEDQVSTYRESVRLFTPEELTKMTSAAGLRSIEPFWGDYHGEEFESTSSRMIYFGALR